jgi:hypothetical protein
MVQPEVLLWPLVQVAVLQKQFQAIPGVPAVVQV